jgi:peptidoglycan hydrolase-like protein with peptidoglycan-binding domain
MTSAVLTEVPLAAGGAILGALARALRWGVAQYARAPLSNTAIAALATFSLMASANALFGQQHMHPAPLFAPATQQVAEIAPVPVQLSHRPKPVAAPVKAVQTTGSLPPLPAAAGAPIGNNDVVELQVKLKALGLLDGAADGLYGPKTARAIKKFEEQAGLKPRGMLTREILAAVRAAPIAALPVQPQPTPQTVATPPVVTTAEQAPEALPALPAATAQPEMVVPGPEAQVTPLPAPKPLAAAVGVTEQPATPAGRPLPRSGEELIEIAGNVAANAVDTLAAAVNGDVQMGPAEQPMPPKATALAEASPQVQSPEPEQVDVAEGTDAEEADFAEAAGSGADPVADIVTAEMQPVPTVPPATPVNDPKLVAKVQRGLASLGFLRGDIDGIPGETTAKAIRNFEVWNNYDVTGRVSRQLLDLLVAAGAQI